MNLDSIFFISVFLPLVLALYYLVSDLRLKNTLLLLAGLVFYACGSLYSLLVLVIIAFLNFLLGKCTAKKWLLVLGIGFNLAILFGYKFLDLAQQGYSGRMQITADLIPLLGISFFTFKAISYLVDTYKDPAKRAENFGAFLLYLSFFPQIMAGPITRFEDFAPQLKARQPGKKTLLPGIRRFVVGLGKKLILAGTLANVVDPVFALDAGLLDARLAWIGALGYTLQIYFDFSGYSDMAIGLAGMFGFETGENFRYPYIATTIGDFWRRWHISLSSWFRDYLYIPLGGNRKGLLRAGINKMVVFTLCGLWHGVTATFLLWGLWHGLLSALESLKVIPAEKLRRVPVVGHIYTLLAVCLGFVMFRAGSVSQGFAIIGAMFTGFTPSIAGTVTWAGLYSGKAVTVFILSALLCFPWFSLTEKSPGLRRALNMASYPAVLILLVLCLVKLASGGFAPFIYAQF